MSPKASSPFFISIVALTTTLTLSCTSPLPSSKSSQDLKTADGSPLKPPSLTQAKRSPVSSLKISSTHRRALQEAGPLGGLVWSGEGELLLSTAEKLWVYHPEKNQLRLISLPASEHQDSSSLIRVQHQERKSTLFLKNPHHIYLIRLQPELKVIQIALSGSESALGAGLFKGLPTLISPHNLWSLNPQGKPLKTLSLPPLPQKEVKALIADDQIWVYSQSNIWTLQPQENGTMHWKSLVQGLRDIQNLLSHKTKLIVQTPYTIITMNQEGEMERTIPVSSKRKISHIQLENSQHLYAFDDGRVEIYDLNSHTMEFLELPLKMKAPLSKIALYENKIATLIEGQLRLFELKESPPTPEPLKVKEERL